MKHWMYVAGNFISVSIGIALAIDYGIAIGSAVGYSMILLADIRYEVTK